MINWVCCIRKPRVDSSLSSCDGWPGVGSCHLMSPSNELLAAIIALDDTFNQGWAVFIRRSPPDRVCQLFTVGSAVPFAMAVLGVESFDQCSVIPILNVIVQAIVNLHLDCVSAVIDQEYHDGQLESNHLRDLLHRYLEGAVPDHDDILSMRRA